MTLGYHSADELALENNPKRVLVRGTRPYSGKRQAARVLALARNSQGCFYRFFGKEQFFLDKHQTMWYTYNILEVR